VSENFQSGDLSIATDYVSAMRSNGDKITFTRTEARALSCLLANPDRLLTRSQLLDAVSEPGSEKNDRTIDLVITRLRRKLGDSATTPRYVATRYGEGYVWVGGGPVRPADHADSYVVVGPLRGLAFLGADAPRALDFGKGIVRSLGTLLPAHRRVVFNPDRGHPDRFPNGGPDIVVDLTFVADGGCIDCIVGATAHKEDRTIAADRRRVSLGTHGSPVPQDLANWILSSAWRASSTDIGSGDPLPVALHSAAFGPNKAKSTVLDGEDKLLSMARGTGKKTIAAWTENARRFDLMLSEHPKDPRLLIMKAIHIHSKYVQFGFVLFSRPEDTRGADEDTIERLVLKALPLIRHDPEYAIMAAKLLFFLDRGYHDMAIDMAETSLKASVNVASSMAVVGQLRAFTGNIDHGVRLITQAAALSRRNSDAHLFTLVLKCQTLMAAGDFDALQLAKRELYRLRPEASFFFEPIFAHPDKLSVRAKAAALLMNRKRATAAILFVHYVSARLFKNAEHRKNAILTPWRLFTRRFGQTVLNKELCDAYPRLVQSL